jgi:hypothetical protein
MGRQADTVLLDRLTASWQLSCMPAWPQYCRATPTECLPFFLRNAGIVGHPGGEGRTGGHLRQDVVADGWEEDLVIPGRYGDGVMQGLRSAPDLAGVETGLVSRRAAMGSALLRSPASALTQS